MAPHRAIAVLCAVLQLEVGPAARCALKRVHVASSLRPARSWCVCLCVCACACACACASVCASVSACSGVFSPGGGGRRRRASRLHRALHLLCLGILHWLKEADWGVPCRVSVGRARCARVAPPVQGLHPRPTIASKRGCGWRHQVAAHACLRACMCIVRKDCGVRDPGLCVCVCVCVYGHLCVRTRVRAGA